MSAPVLFLDIDGVLNSRDWYKRREGGAAVRSTAREIDPNAMARLNRLLADASAVVCVSSTWRHMGHLKVARELINAGLRHRVVGVTPEVREPYPRGKEIALWLRDHPEVRTYAIVDDDFDAGVGHADRFVQTSWSNGLLDEHVARLAAMLGGAA